MSSKTTKGLLRGAKFSRSHSTVIEAAKDLLRVAKVLPEVTKIVLSEISQAKPAPRRVKFSPIPSGLRMQVRGGTCIQLFYIYTNDSAKTEEALQKAWNP